MSTISSVSSTPNPYRTADQNGFGQIVKNFNGIGSALQSGNLTAAQTALSAFQQSLPGNSQASANSPFGNNSQANTDYQSLVGALQSGNLPSAQQAFTSLQSDLNAAQSSTRPTRRGHHHHGSGGWSAESSQNGSGTGSTPTSTAGTSSSWPTSSTNGTGTSSPATSTSGTSASGPTAATNGITMSFTAEIEIVQIGITLNVTA
jgi:hypothetical protein